MNKQTYTITAKNQNTPKHLDGPISHADFMNEISWFMSFNPTRKKFATDDDRIAYFNKHSFYTAKKVK
jgi:hypothetical protein